MSYSWLKPLSLETEVAKIIHRQELNGVAFDLEKAHSHVALLTHKREKLYNEIRPYLQMEVSQYGVTLMKPFLKNGGKSKSVLDWYDEEADLVSGPFSRVVFSEPELGSRQKLTKQLLRHGWKPKLFTEKGSPKLTHKGVPVSTLSEIEAPVGNQIAEWYTLQHRQSQIQGWINSVRADGRLTAGANSCGTNTARMRHRGVVNVPKADPKVVFGYEMRDLFIAREGYVLVGHDASGLEARVMAHYTTPYDGGEFADEILHGDVHSKNARIFYPSQTIGREKGDPIFDSYRSKSKNGFYALVYGAQPPKLAETLGCSVGEAKRLFNAFWEQNPGLGQLREKIIKISDSVGWIPGIDGRKIYIRSSHSALNALFQSAGAIIMKVSMVILDHWVRRDGLDVRKVLDMHDEAQAEELLEEIVIYTGSEDEMRKLATVDKIWSLTDKHDGTFQLAHSPYGELAVKSIRRAGEYLDFRCDLDAEYKVGRSWAETH